MYDALADDLVAFFNFINEPPQYEDQRMVRDYRHELARLWMPLHDKINAAFSQSHEAVMQTRIETLEFELKAARNEIEIADGEIERLKAKAGTQEPVADDEFVQSTEVQTDYERGVADGIAKRERLAQDVMAGRIADELEIEALKARIEDLKRRLAAPASHDATQEPVAWTLDELVRIAPDVLKALGARLTDLLDADEWNSIEPILLELSALYAAPQPASVAQASCDWAIQECVPSDGFECYFLLRDDVIVGEFNGRQTDQRSRHLQDLVEAANAIPTQETIHYLTTIRVRLETLYAASGSNPRLREQLSDEVDWIDAQLDQPSPLTSTDGNTP